MKLIRGNKFRGLLPAKWVQGRLYHYTHGYHISMVRGYHVYQGVWDPTIGEELPCRKEHGNTQDPYAVAVLDGVNCWPCSQENLIHLFHILQLGGNMHMPSNFH